MALNQSVKKADWYQTKTDISYYNHHVNIILWARNVWQQMKSHCYVIMLNCILIIISRIVQEFVDVLVIMCIYYCLSTLYSIGRINFNSYKKSLGMRRFVMFVRCFFCSGRLVCVCIVRCFIVFRDLLSLDT